MSGKLIAIGMSVFIVGFFITMRVAIEYSSTRTYNRDLTHKLKEPLNRLFDMQDYIMKTKSKYGTLDNKILDDIAGELEYFYFPNNINDPRLPLIVCRRESRGYFKDFKGDLNKHEIGLGYYILYGNQFKVKAVLVDKLEDLLKLTEDNRELDASYLKSGEAILIGGKKKNVKIEVPENSSSDHPANHNQ